MAVTGFCEVEIPIPVSEVICIRAITVRKARRAVTVRTLHADEPDGHTGKEKARICALRLWVRGMLGW